MHLFEIIPFLSDMASCRLECLLAHILQTFIKVQHYEIISLIAMDPECERAMGPHSNGGVSMHNRTGL